MKGITCTWLGTVMEDKRACYRAFFILLPGAIVLSYCLFPATSKGDSVVARKDSDMIQPTGGQFAKRRLYLDLPRF
jgi:hypothetical protein